MNPTVLSIFVYGIYLISVGAGFLLVPNLILPLFKFPKTDEPWIRVMAILVLVIAFFYMVAVYYDLHPVFWATVFGRLFAFISFLILVLLKKSRPMLILFGMVDALGALWTFLTLLK